MKTDRQIQKDVLDQLAFDPAIKSERIGVSVQDGVVTLDGTVPSFAEKNSAEARAFRVSGVKSIVKKIKVELPGAHIRNDFDIAKAASEALEWNVLVASDVKASVENAVVTLRGNVEWAYQREAAVNAVRHLKGVKAIDNLISIHTKTKPLDIKTKIENALTRSAQVEAQGIQVEVDDDRVVLTGHVRSHEEYDEAKWAAWAVPGISSVENRLVIGR